MDEWDDRPKSGIDVIAKGDERFVGEDEAEDVKDNWDDEDEEEISEPVVPAPKPATSNKASKNLAKKIAEKEQKEKQRAMTSEEVLADKLYRQRLQEESDLKLAKETIGISDASDSIQAADLSNKEDFEEFRKTLVSKLRVVEKSAHYVNFLEGTIRDLCASLDIDDLKRISSSITTLYNEKLKAQKQTKKKNKPGGAKVNVERSAMNYDYGGYDDEDMDGFM